MVQSKVLSIYSHLLPFNCVRTFGLNLHEKTTTKKSFLLFVFAGNRDGTCCAANRANKVGIQIAAETGSHVSGHEFKLKLLLFFNYRLSSKCLFMITGCDHQAVKWGLRLFWYRYQSWSWRCLWIHATDMADIKVFIYGIHAPKIVSFFHKEFLAPQLRLLHIMDTGSVLFKSWAVWPAQNCQASAMGFFN